MTNHLRRILIATLVTLTASTVRSQDIQLAIFDLGNLGEPDASAVGVNERGEIVGVSKYESGRLSSHGFHWFRGEMIDLGVISGTDSGAFEINDAGRIAGRSDTVDTTHAVVWEPDGTITDLGEPGVSSHANSINNIDQVVGHANGSAVLWDTGAKVELGSLGSGPGEAQDINESTVITGWSRVPEGPNHGFVWYDGVMSELTGLSEHFTLPRRINELNQIVGMSEDEGFRNRAVLWENGVPMRIDTHPWAASSSAYGINNLGEVVGLIENPVFGDFAFLYRDGEMLVLDDFLPDSSGWNLRRAVDINDKGLMVGKGYRDGVEIFAPYLAVPVHPALALSQPSPGLSNQNNTLTVTGATPGNRIYFVYGTVGGGTIIPTCDLADAAVQIDDAKIAGSAIADGTGTATLTAFVPAAASNLGDILIQAVDPATCMQSQLVVEVFE